MKRLLLMIAAMSLVPACYCGPYDPYYYYDAAFYDPYYAASEGAYAYGAYDPSGAFSSKSADELESAAAAIAGRAGGAFTTDCVTATTSGPTVTLELDKCESRFGGRNMDGLVGITLFQDGEQFRFEVRSSNLFIDDELFILDFDGTATSNGTQRVVAFESRSRMSEQVDARTSTGTITWEQGRPCVTVDAQSTSSRDKERFSSTLVGFQQCAGQCPSAGAVTVEGEKGVFSGTFDGSDHLRVRAPNGGERPYGLQCR